ncbi:tryptophan synthase subunit alpha [Desertibacillus haloalkaliphilus]|uniref:tryptophan synthase subunit alpha n=1 Tax=Desertibacillus haloalkaliphilus TaxID=1328930 RepID=UPI001C25FF25|nr:tryptophan synthase subunit alpha [Desertibacillus haloalkaliphilus]MBU8906133.1 tryptophan synthase subunit alpha [Desertibacillus haloalkaliphilus]
MMANHNGLIKGVKNDRKKFLTGYFIAGDPSFEESVRLIKQGVDAGLDVVEVGIPSKSPFLDGDVIQKAQERTRKHFYKKSQYIALLQRLRQEVHVPIWVMGYSSDVVCENLYIDLAEEGLADAFIIPDLSKERLKAVREKLERYRVQVIPVVNKEMNDEDLSFVSQGSDIIYCQLYAGKTGEDVDSLDFLPQLEKKMRKVTNGALMAGFGIKTPRRVQEVIGYGFDGVVVGSEIVRHIEQKQTKTLVRFIRSLKQATK